MIGARLRMTALDALALPSSVTAHGPARWIVAPGAGACTPPRLQAVLSAAWQTVTGRGQPSLVHIPGCDLARRNPDSNPRGQQSRSTVLLPSPR
jgi:hypothetical protein